MKTAPGAMHFTRSIQCKRCHSKIYEEWKTSWHGKAYTDPDVLMLSKDFQDPQCSSCHAPAPLYTVGFGARVFVRQENRRDGVNCITCHVRPDGRVVGVRGLKAPCDPVKDDRLLTAKGIAKYCGGCHNQHWLVDEWSASKWAVKKVSCLDCHNPRVDRPIADGGPVRKGVLTHVFEGGHYLWMLRKAAVVKTEVKDGKLIVRVTNSGTGHKMPSDARHRSFNVLVTIRDDEGNLLIPQKEIAEYRLYYRDMHLPSTQIPPFETRESSILLPKGQSGVAKVEWVYCLKPPDKVDKKWTVVKTIEQKF